MKSFWHIPAQPDQEQDFQGSGIVSPGQQGPYARGFVIAERFVIHSLIGSGGTGSVYRATDREQQREVAVKVLHPTLTETPHAVESFLKEAKLSIGLKHPDILRVYDAIDFTGGKALSMELLDGGTLRSTMESHPSTSPFSAEEISHLILPVGTALSYAHKTTIHCDIKPENIGITKDGDVKLMDFGIAKLRQTHSLTGARISITRYQAGTPYYMAPEQIRNPSQVDARVDQYALGIIIYELFTGEPPIGLAQPLRERRPDLPSTLALTVDRAVSGNPQDRFPTMDAMVAALDRGFSQARHPVMRRLASGRIQHITRRIVVMAGFILAFTLLALFLRQRQTDVNTQANLLWNDLADLEIAHEGQRQWHREQRQALAAASDTWRAAPIPSSPDWLTASNRWHFSHAIVETGGNPISDSILAKRETSLGQLRRLMAYGHLNEAQERLDQIGTSLAQEQNWIEQAESITEKESQAAALLKTAKGLPDLIDQSHLPDLYDVFKNSQAAKRRGDYEKALTGFGIISVSLSPVFQKAHEKAVEQLDQARHRWELYYPDTDPKLLSFLADPEELYATAQTWSQLSRYDQTLELLSQATSHYTRWADDMEQLLHRTAPSWTTLPDKIENTIGMRFARVDSAYLSIWETRVIDFARFVEEIPSADIEAGDTWKEPGFPLSPTSPAVGVPRAVATRFAYWLQAKFPEHRVECGLPGFGKKPILDSIIATGFGSHFSILVDPSQWISGHFKEHYEDQEWSAHPFIRVVGQNPPDQNGIFDLRGNVWEWQSDDFQYQDNEPSAYTNYPILRGGAAGTVTYQGHEPPNPNMKFILRKEVIGFRIRVGATPLNREFF